MGTKLQSLLAQSVLVVQILFTIGWVVAGFLQGDGYSAARHDISDLGAKTSLLPWVWMVPMGITGAVTIWFALGSLRPVLKMSGIQRPVGAWFVAFPLMGLDNFSDSCV